MKKPLGERIRSSNIVVAISEKAKKTTLPGFGKMPMYDVAVFFWQSLSKGALTQRASAIAFNFFLALFPALLFAFTLIPYLPIDNFQEKLMVLIEQAIPESIYHFIFGTLDGIINRPHSGLLSFGLLMTLYFSTRGFKSIISSFHQSYILSDKRLSFWKLQWNSMVLVLIFGFVTGITIALTTFSNLFISVLLENDIIRSAWTYYLLRAANIVLYTAMIYFIISFVYYIGSPRKEKFRFFSAGSTISTLLYGISYLGFDSYINNFSNYNALYGSIGTIIILLMWIYFNALIVLIGYELNLSISNANTSASKTR